jgi:hypothetical protein
MPVNKSGRLRLLHMRDEIDGVTAASQNVSFEQYR